MNTLPKRIKVLINQRFLTQYREDFFYELAKDNTLSLLVTFGDRRSKKHGKFKSIDTVPRFNFRRLYTFSFVFERFGHINQFFFSPGVLIQLIRFRPDVVLTEGTSNILNNFLLCGYCLVTNTPYIWWDLGTIRGQASENIFRKLLYPFIRHFFSHAHTILAYSNFAKAYFIDQGIPERRICVAANTIRLDSHLSYQALKIDEACALKKRIRFNKRFGFIAVGSIDTNKRFDILITVFLDLFQQYNDIGLIIVGDGSELETLKQMAGNTSSIYFAGAQYKDIGLYYMISDVFVLPGLGGLAINEAMVYGLPVISVPADGTERDLIINYQTGILLENNNQELIASAMEWFIQNKNKATSMGEAARAHIVKNFDLPMTIDKISTALHAIERK
jgi:glycosyltransferase involved in cell wall biosynthesis